MVLTLLLEAKLNQLDSQVDSTQTRQDLIRFLHKNKAAIGE